MQFTVSSKELLAALRVVSKAIPRRPPFPALGHVHARLEAFTLHLTATDLEVTVQTSLVPELNPHSLADGIALFPCKRLMELVKSMPKETLTLTGLNPTRLGIVSSSAGYELATEAPENYPSFPALTDEILFTKPSEDLGPWLEKGAAFASNDELRPQLCGVLVKTEKNEMDIVATNGHTLWRMNSSAVGVPDFDFILPAYAATLVAKFAKAKDVNFVPVHLVGKDKATGLISQVAFRCGAVTVLSRTIEGRYPNYGAVIPKYDNSDPHLVVNRDELAKTVKQASLGANEISGQVVFRLNGKCTIEAEDIETGSVFHSPLPGNYNGEDLKIGFRGPYVLDCLSAMDSPEVIWRFDKPTSAAVMEPAVPDGRLALIMPVRLD